MSLQLLEPGLDRFVEAAAVAVAGLRDSYQAVGELGQGDSGELPEAGIHRDGGEAGQGVELVDEEAAVAFAEEVDSRHASPSEGGEGGDGEGADALGGGRRQVGGREEAGGVLEVLVGVVVELGA